MECTDRCSHRATDDSLSALGFPVHKVDKCVGSDVVVRPGESFELALYHAWQAGAIRLCSRTGRDHFTGAEPEWSRRYAARKVAA